ncbi:Transmembrane protein [Hirschfeldia incana]|nr:Transmembrane protein [Hirschfeldia incana]
MKSTVLILLMYLLLVVSCFAIGSENMDSNVYEIDYRGPETHNSRPPPETLHGKRPFIHHKTSAAGSAGGHVGGRNLKEIFFKGRGERLRSCE